MYNVHNYDWLTIFNLTEIEMKQSSFFTTRLPETDYDPIINGSNSKPDFHKTLHDCGHKRLRHEAIMNRKTQKCGTFLFDSIE